ncbi:MAG TPA: molecular chaperone DnaJ [Patescibacteria group bacterium]|nr:molecular chaperone DnaJ [Patescibacteria group bacterium]
MNKKDYYAVLGVSKEANQEEIKKAFRTLAHKHHPDKSGGDAEKFKEINEAYQVLGDPEKRSRYDRLGSAAFENGGFSGADGFSGAGFGAAGWEDLGDLFGDLFGNSAARSRRPARGEDLEMDVELAFKEGLFGTVKNVRITKPSSCPSCRGSGAAPGAASKICSVCAGSGWQAHLQRTILGNVQTRIVCPACVGTGHLPEHPCPDCRGEGVRSQGKTLEVRIPPGVEDGMTLRVRGEGAARKGAEPGDLFLRLHLASDPRFEREGPHLFSSVSIGFTQAALGDTLDIETVDGPVSLKITAGIQSGTELRLRGKGVPSGSGRRGDHIVTVRVRTPEKVNRRQRQLLEDLDLREKPEA